MRRVLLFAVMALALPALAQHANTIPWMTGEHLARLLGDVDPTTIHWTPESPFRTRALAADYRNLANREFVQGYIQAVHDATEGKVWCWSDKYQPHPDELDADARHALQQMSDAQLKRNAADLIAEVWHKRWPCPDAKRRTR